MKATWLVATHFRPQLLERALESINDQYGTPGWAHETVVVHHKDDQEAATLCRIFGVTHVVSSTQATGGAKRTLGLRHATGDLVLVADDDDIQSPYREQVAIRAFTKGHSISELREFRYLHLETGAVVRWCGRGDPPRTQPVTVGTARNYRRAILQRVGGWRALPRLIEKDIQARINARFPGPASRAHDLGTELSDTTICLQHGSNIWDDRPAVPKGQTVDRGLFRLVGEGHWSEAPGFPANVAQRLGLS